MKKQYIAPDLYFESFVLSQSIAAGCSEQGIGAANEWSAFDYFVDGNSLGLTCTEEWDDTKSEAYCYWQGNIKMFFS